MTQLSHGTLAIHNRQLALRWLSGCLVLIAASSIAVAQAGQLDRTFVSKGIFLENFDGSTGTGSALQSDGRSWRRERWAIQILPRAAVS